MSTRSKTFPAWAFLSLAANMLLVLAIAWVLVRKYHWMMPSPVSRSVAATRLSYSIVTSTPDPDLKLGHRVQLSYKQWLTLLQQEAAVVATQKPEHLTILIGDSLSLWFPNDLLPLDRTWLNQGISGETSAGLLHRLGLLDKTQPEAIFVMIGINDLIRGADDETILANQRFIIRYLRLVHPKAKIVVQSILPHSIQQVTWEGAVRLRSIPNRHIRTLNQKLMAITEREGVIYLDLYPLFADAEGNLKRNLSTDGLHLSREGYLVWRNALIVFNQVALKIRNS